MIIIRPMQEADVETVMEIETFASPVPWTKEIFSDCIKVGYHCWVLSENNKVLGFALLTIGASEGHILNFAVHPEQRNKGLGSRLLKHVLRQAWHLESDNVILEVRVSNQDAQRLYQRFNFTQIGTRPKYYQTKDGGTEDALLLEIKKANI